MPGVQKWYDHSGNPARGKSLVGHPCARIGLVSAMAPGLYHMSTLLDQLQGKTHVTTILFYLGSIEGTTGLPFMDLKDREVLSNYRVKNYG